MAEAMLALCPRARGWTRLGVFTSTDATGQQGDKSFDRLGRGAAISRDITLVDRAHFNTQDVSVAAADRPYEERRSRRAWIGWAHRLADDHGVWRGFGASPGSTFPASPSAANHDPCADGAIRPRSFPPNLYFVSSEFTLYGRPGLQGGPRGSSAKQEEMYRTYAAQSLKPDQGSVARLGCGDRGHRRC